MPDIYITYSTLTWQCHIGLRDVSPFRGEMTKNFKDKKNCFYQEKRSMVELWFDLTRDASCFEQKYRSLLGKLAGWCWIHRFIFPIFCQMLHFMGWSRTTKYILLKHRNKIDAFFHRKAQHVNNHCLFDLYPSLRLHSWLSTSTKHPCISLSPQPSCYCVDELTVTRWSDLLKIQSPELALRCSFAQGYTDN